MKKINRLQLEADFLKKELTDDQLILLRSKPGTSSDLITRNKLKVRRQLIQFILNKGFSLRSVALVSELSPTRVYQIINK